MTKRCTVFATWLLLGALLAPAAEPKPFDWPQWRGPQRTSICKETGLLKTWPNDGPAIAWKAKDLGAGYGAPSIAAGKIFGGGTDGTDEFIWALDEANGKELWKTRIAAWRQLNRGDGTRSTPTVDGALLYVLGASGDLVCLESATGNKRWSKNLAKDFGGRMMSGWGWSESPLIDGDNLICTPGGKDATLLALKKTTGDLVWKAPVPGGDGAAYSSVVVSNGAGVRQYLTLLQRGIVSVAAKDGKFLWRYDRIANGTANIPTAIVKDDLVFCSTGYNQGGSALLKLAAAGGGVKADEVYYLSNKVFQNHHGGMVLIGDHIYAGHGHNQGAPTCVEFKTGKIAWKQDRGPGSGSAALLYADGMLYFRYQNGILALVEANPAAYKLVSSFKLPDQSDKPSWPHPVIANGKLYIRDQGILLCFDVKQPQ